MARQQDLDPSQLPPRWERKAWKDPTRAADQIAERPAGTPCEAAWRVPLYRLEVHAWLDRGALAPSCVIFVVLMPDKLQRDAVFVRELRLMKGIRMYLAVDSISRTVFAGRRLDP